MKSKGDFIIDLLVNRKISENDRERLLQLSAKEFEKNDDEYLKILSEIESFKKIYQHEQDKVTTKIDNVLDYVNEVSNSLLSVSDLSVSKQFREGRTILTDHNKTNNNEEYKKNINNIENKDNEAFVFKQFNIFKLLKFQLNKLNRILFLKKNNINNKDKSDLIATIQDDINKSNYELEIGMIQENENRKIPNPKHVAEFMSLFNKRDGLKYLTHDFDENTDFNIDEFLRSAFQVFSDHTRELDIPPSLWRIVKEFAFDSKQASWTSISDDYTKDININTGWASEELRHWSKQNSLHPIRNEKYEGIINDFKRITRIKDPNLEKLIDATLVKVLEKDITSYEIKKCDLDKADFYTHVKFLKIALETIFKEIKDRSSSDDRKKITISYEFGIQDEFFIRKLYITHHNSYPKKELQVILREWKEKGSIGKISANLEGYCYWSVETIIEDKPSRVNILRDNDTPAVETIDSNVEGFTHILTFYYK